MVVDLTRLCTEEATLCLSCCYDPLASLSAMNVQQIHCCWWQSNCRGNLWCEVWLSLTDQLLGIKWNLILWMRQSTILDDRIVSKRNQSVEASINAKCVESLVEAYYGGLFSFEKRAGKWVQKEATISRNRGMTKGEPNCSNETLWACIDWVRESQVMSRLVLFVVVTGTKGTYKVWLLFQPALHSHANE